MAIWQYHCEICGEIFRTKKEAPEHCNIPATKMLTSPATKYMEKAEGSDKSTLVGADKIYLERARNYSRDHETDDLIAMNKDHTNPEAQGWIVDGRRRKRIDDV